MSRNELNNLKHIVMKTAKSIYDNEKFFVSFLAAKADRLAQEMRNDATTVGFANFLRKRATTKDLFITRAELKDVYNKLYTPSTKFAEYFADELGLEKDNHVTKMYRDPNEGSDTSLVEAAYKQAADPFLAEQFSDIFNGETPKQYSSALAKSASKMCARELNSCGILPRNVEVVAGKPDLLLCKATCETPKGQSHILIPVEARNGRALIPSVFLTTAGFVDLNEKFIKEHLRKTAGKSYRVDAQDLLNKLSGTQETKLKPLSDVEKIVMKTAAAKATPASHTMDGILYQEVDPAHPELKVEASPDVQRFAAKLSSDTGAAEFVHGKQAVDAGRGLVLHELKSAGYRNAQVVVAGVNNESVNFAVSVDGRFGFKVPVKVAGGRVEAPKVVVAGGGVFEFSANGISRLLSNADSDPEALARTSQSYGLKPSELVTTVREAMTAGNYLKAEDALHVLKTAGDAVAYQAAYNTYLKALGAQPAETEQKTECCAQVKHAHSKYMICSHTGLPVNKVYQDKYGNCQPLYRRSMEESSEGGFFMNSRVELG